MGVALQKTPQEMVCDAVLLGELSENLSLFLAVDSDGLDLSVRLDDDKPAVMQVAFNNPSDRDLWRPQDLPRAVLVLCNTREMQRYFGGGDPMKLLVNAQSLPAQDVIGELPLEYGVKPEPVQYAPGGREKIMTALLD